MTDTFVAALRQVPRLHGVRHRVPVGRAVRQAHRGHARADRAALPALARRPAVPRGCSSRSSPTPAGCASRAAPLWLYQAAGLHWLLRRSGLLKLLPARLRAMESLRRRSTWTRSWRAHAGAHRRPQGPRRGRVGLLTGCVQQRVLPRGERGHGARAGRRRVRRDRSAGAGLLRRADGPRGARGRGAGLRAANYRRVRSGRRRHRRHQRRRLRVHDEGVRPPAARRSAYADRGQRVRGEVQRYLGGAGRSARRGRRATPCRCVSRTTTPVTSSTRSGVKLQPRAVLATIPRLEVVEIPEAAICCGSAGIYNLVEPEAAQELGDRKAGHILTTGAEAIVSSNPGCLLQLRAALARRRPAAAGVSHGRVARRLDPGYFPRAGTR